MSRTQTKLITDMYAAVSQSHTIVSSSITQPVYDDDVCHGCRTKPIINNFI